MRLMDPVWLMGLWGLAALGALVVYGVVARRRALRRFVDSELAPRMAPGWSATRQVVKGMVVVGAVGMVIVALARPSWGEHEEETIQKGRDVCFLIDVSRSMLAQDMAPNRLERAKLWVRDVLRTAEGDRVGIVAFAGDTAIACPLTHDYGFARTALDDVDTDTVARGGTLIGDAVRTSGLAAVSANGVLGDPTGATEEEGRRIFGMLVEQLCAAVDRWRDTLER